MREVTLSELPTERVLGLYRFAWRKHRTGDPFYTRMLALVATELQGRA